MSVEHRHSDEAPPTEEQSRTDSRSCTESTCQSQTVTFTGPGHAGNSRPTAQSLAARIERTQLRLQVATLRRALETSERRRQTVIDRYEQLLAERDRTSEDSSADRSSSTVKRLLEVWP